MRQSALRFFIISSIAILLFSCGGRARCRSNCYEIRIAGYVVDYETEKKLGGIAIELYWEDAERGFVSITNRVKKSITDKDGSFDFTATIDTTEFAKDKALRLSTNSDKYSSGLETMGEFDPFYFSKIELRVSRIKEGL